MKNDLQELIYQFKDEMKICQLLEDEETDKVIPCFELVSYPAGTVIFNEGEPGDFIGFVISGKLEVKKHTEFNKQIILAILSKGSFVGELSLFDKQPRSATVIAHEDSQLIILRRDKFESFIQQYPHIGSKILIGIIRTLSARLRKATERLASIF